MKKGVFIAGLVAALILAVVSWFVLPSTVAVQVGLDGNVSNIMPKYAAVLIPTAISVAGGIIGLNTEKSDNKKQAAMMFIGMGIMVFMMIFNS